MRKTTCSKCGGDLDRPGRYCLACHAAYMREWRPSHPLKGEALIKARARNRAGSYLRRGRIERQACEICGEPAQMHHEDYSKPLAVKWLCRKHHTEAHHAKKDLQA